MNPRRVGEFVTVSPWEFSCGIGVSRTSVSNRVVLCCTISGCLLLQEAPWRGAVEPPVLSTGLESARLVGCGQGGRRDDGERWRPQESGGGPGSSAG